VYKHLGFGVVNTRYWD